MSRAPARERLLFTSQGSWPLLAHERLKVMSGLEWFLGTMLAVLYLFCIFTVGLITFQKGHFVLGILGIFLPFLWLVGAVLPDRNGPMTTGSGRMTPSL
jgi:hypothetical protein